MQKTDPVYFDKTYYLEPAPGGEKAYTLIVEAMEKTKKIGIAKVLIRSKQALAALRVKDKVLVMETIFYPDEIRSPASLNHGLDSGKLHENEIKMAVSLIENLSTDFDPARYHDDYRQALWEVIEARIAGQEIAIPVQNAAKGNVIDLMDALKASVQLAEDNRKKENKKVGSARKKAKATGT